LVGAFSLSHDRIDWTLKGSEWAFSAIEPYAVDASTRKLALAGGSYVRLIDMHSGEETFCRNPWLSQVHTVHFSADGRRLLVASAGFDAVVEFDTDIGGVLWEWFAWDHGYDRSTLGHHVVRDAEKRDALMAMGREAVLVDDPSKFRFGVPTRLIPAHLNSARYDVNGRILVCLFHQGAGIVIDRVTGKVQEVVSGLVNPHKLSRRRRGGYFISDTRAGKLVFIDESHCCAGEITLGGLPGLERQECLGEFLQNTTELREDLFACVDIHRNTLWLVDVARRKFRGVKFPREWSVHDVASLGKERVSRIGQLVGRSFGKVEAIEEGEGKRITHFSPSGQEIATFKFDAEGRVGGLDIAM
jgi:hypothetical protein